MKKTMKKLMFAALAAVTLFVLPTRGATSVPYVDEHGADMGSQSCTVIASGTTTLPTGWYAVTSNTSNSNRVEVTGNVNLILCDGATLTSYLGIEVPTGKSITIWGQSGGTGRLNVIWPNKWSAGIGGSLRAGFGSITIRGGNISAVGHQGAAGIGGGYDGPSGVIDIRGGTITTTGGDSGCVGIGGGYYQGCGTITISGGTITAAGGEQAAGIGTTYQGTGGTIIISGGTITATGGKFSAGIGSGYYGTLGSITITGGDITATGGESGAGIGTGLSSNVGTIRISDATVNATGGHDGAGVGCGQYGSGNALTIENSSVTAQGGMYGSGIGSGEGNSELSNPGFGSIAISGARSEVHATGGLMAAGIGGGLYGGTGDITISNGTVVATGGDGGGAGIGGGWFGGDGTVTINGGTITATAGQECEYCYDCGAGIGGGDGRSLRSVVINGGDITAVGGRCSAGIGGGSSHFFFSQLEQGKPLEELQADGTAYVPGIVIIRSGTISATGGEQASGIGGGGFASGGTVTISGGCVTANGGLYGAGIGGGKNGNGGTVSISDGTVTANGGAGGAGIGGGEKGNGATVTISGGDVTAAGGGTETTSGAGIGGGYGGAGGDVTITGGSVRAAAVLGIRQYGESIGYGSPDYSQGNEMPDEGALHIGVGQKVGSGSDLDNFQWVELGQREFICRARGDAVAIVHCEPHSYDKTGTCTLCGSHDGQVFPDVPYMNETGFSQHSAACLPLADSDTAWHTAGLHGGWYAVTNDLAILSRVKVSGSVNLILCDGATLTLPKGIEVSENNSLTIWRQASATGALMAGTTNGSDATCDSGNAAIGGNGGESAGAIAVNGGTVTAAGGENAAGIGGGNGGGGGSVTINGGTVTANGGSRGAAIGGGNGGSGGIVNIKGGMVTAGAGADAQAIGHGYGTDSAGDLQFFLMGVYTNATATEPVTMADRETACRGAWVRINRCASHSFENNHCRFCGAPVQNLYLDPTEAGAPQKICEAYTLYAGQLDLEDGWYVVSSDMSVDGRINIRGDVHLILCEATTLAALKGVHVTGANRLTIWGQEFGTGAIVVANTDYGNAGIGGNSNEACGTITVNGGMVTVISGFGGAGIGGGVDGGGGTVVIGNGTVTATSDGNAAGIGGGVNASGGNVSIVGGTVVANGGSNGAGIGGGVNGSGGNVSIIGGTVTVNGGSNAAGIGGGLYGSGGNVSIIGGTVMITRHYSIAAIGCGSNGGDNGTLNLPGMRVGTPNGDGVNWARVADRVSTCQQGRTTVLIERCESHPDSESDDFCDLCGTFYLQYVSGSIQYRDSASGYLLVQTNFALCTDQLSMATGWYAVTESRQLDGRLAIFGDVNLILCDGAELTITGGIHVAAGNSLTIWAQSADNGTAGRLTVTEPASGNAGIGGNAGESGGAVTIHGGTITVVGGENAQAIGRGSGNGDSGSLNVSAVNRVGRLDGSGNVVEWASPGSIVDLCRNADGAVVFIERCYPHIDDDSDYRCEGCGAYLNICSAMHYLDPASENLLVRTDCSLYAGQQALNSGWYAVDQNRRLDGRLDINGNVNLILCDGAELTLPSGIHVTGANSLTVWAQSKDSDTCGALTAVSPGADMAGIGGNKKESGGEITINGGRISATGKYCGAGIGSGDAQYGNGGTITINGGTVSATGGGWAAGIGGAWLSSGGNITINGGTVVATGGYFVSYVSNTYYCGAGIGAAYDVNGGTIKITGGTVTAVGAHLCPGIGGGNKGGGGTITITGGTVTAIGDGTEAIGAGAASDDSGNLCIDGMRVGTVDGENAVTWVNAADRISACRDRDQTSVRLTLCTDHNWQDGFCVYCGAELSPGQYLQGGGDADNPYLISSAEDWEKLGLCISLGKTTAGLCFRLTADISVTNMLGASDHPFDGTFDGDGHTLTVAIDSSNVAAAPFGKIDGATIKNLTVAGTVTSGGNHAAGLVGGCGNDHPSTILNCTVAATVNGSGYAGGIVGHGGEGTLTLDGCVFSGTVSGFDTCAGGLLGWCDALTLTITNCLCTGAFTPAGEGKYHPIACRYASRNVTATVADAYYLNTIVPTVLGVNPTVATSNLIPGAEGTPVSAPLVAGEWAQPVTAADGNEYYAWTTAPAGRLIASYTFDDAGNGGTNLLHASVGLDAIVRATRTTPVAGIGNITAVTDAAILSGLSAGDGAVSIPNGQHLAVPVPAALLSAHGRPYTVVMKIRVPDTVGWRCLLNMPASNDTDAMVYLQQTTRNIYLKQFDKTSGAGIAASNGNVAADQWATIAFAFGENATDVYLDGTRVLHTTGALANSYADCAASGGYILVGADDSGDDDLFYLSDFRIYEGAVAVAGILPGSGTPIAPYLISSTDDWNAFAANVNAGATSAACYRLCADIAITTTVGTSDHPFGGTFDGGGYTLTASLSGTDSFVAPFSAIGGATISNLVVAGTVAGNMHCSGLVGAIVNGVNVIENCKVSAAITSSGSHFGGVIGHSFTSMVTLRGCVFSGSLAGGTYVATFHGWSDDGAETTLIDCLDVSASTQPLGRGHDAACVSNTYYLASKNFSNGERLWSEGKRGKRASVVTAGEGATLAFGALTATYGTSGVIAYATGLEFDGNFYTVSGYVIWAAANGTTGAWNATDASGVHNVFRYLFDKPSGAFENPPILSISFDASGRAVIHTPPFSPSATGFEISILATDDLAGTGATTYPLDADGETTIPASDKPARFFRLRVTER